MSYVIFTFSGILLAIFGALLFCAAAALPLFEAYYGRQPLPAGVQGLGDTSPPRQPLAITGSSGDALSGTLFMPSGEEKDGATVLLAPDFGGFSGDILLWTSFYTSSGFAVAVPDYRCEGKSGAAWRSRGPLEREDLADWIRWAASREGSSGVVLHGHGFGGTLAVDLLRGKGYRSPFRRSPPSPLFNVRDLVTAVIVSGQDASRGGYASFLEGVFGRGILARGVRAASGMFFALRFRRLPDGEGRNDAEESLSGIPVPSMLLDKVAPSAGRSESEETRRVSDFLRRLK